ncbi:MAG: PilZ domain-containing protein [Oligoflexales bacterium]|nr:PilZ domain-containing protein [Oligoflexales bacterium]
MGILQHKRKHIRFKPEPNQFAQIDKKTEGEQFTFEYVALIVDMAPMGGCSLIVTKQINLDVGHRCRIKLGEMSPLLAEVVWIRDIEKDFFRYGFRFLE